MAVQSKNTNYYDSSGTMEHRAFLGNVFYDNYLDIMIAEEYNGH